MRWTAVPIVLKPPLKVDGDTDSVSAITQWHLPPFVAGRKNFRAPVHRGILGWT
jgi:hypothetical protein